MTDPFMPAQAAALPVIQPAASPLDDLLQRIATQRALLAAWQAARDAAQLRYARDIAPLHDAYCALLAQQVQQLDVASASPGLSKADRAALRALVADWAGMLASASRAQAQRAEMQDIQRRHAEATAQPVPPPSDDIEPAEEATAQGSAADEEHGDQEGDWEADWESARAAADQRHTHHHSQSHALPPVLS